MHRRILLLGLLVALALLAAGGTVAGLELAGGGAPARPGLQPVLDGLVSGPGRVAPGGVAFVSGPHGTWIGTAGLANVKTGEPMWAGAPMHLDSNTKTWAAVVILQLAAEGKLRLDDTIERWLPGMFPYGGQITVRELLNHTSGMVGQDAFDRNVQLYVERVRDPRLKAEMLGLLHRLATDPRAKVAPAVAQRFTATLPLLSTPGAEYHYSNIGYEVAGLIAARAGGAPLGQLIQARIAKPLGLSSAAYVPGGEVGVRHPRGYSVARDGSPVDATGWYRVDEGASGAMIASARDEARFLVALMQGRILGRAQLDAMETPSSANPYYGLGIAIVPTCGGDAFGHGGASFSSTSWTLVSPDGRRVAVLLLDGNTSSGMSPGTRSSNAAYAAVGRLFCAA